MITLLLNKQSRIGNRRFTMVRYIFGLVLVMLIHSIVNAQNADPSGNWHVNTNSFLFTLVVARQGEKYVAFLTGDGACATERMDNVTWEGGTLEFRRNIGGVTQWYRVSISDGIMIGRFSYEVATKGAKPSPLAYKYHLTGWNEADIPPIPAVFDINADGFRGRLRIDRVGDSLVGRLKFYAYQNSPYEKLEEEIKDVEW